MNFRASNDLLVHSEPENAPAGVDQESTSRWERWDNLVLYGSFALCVLWTFCYSTDDAFITLRYAANIVHGHGPVFNVGQRVEGFSSPLDLVLIVFVYLIPGSHALLKAKLLSLSFGVLTIVTAKRLIRAVDLPPWGRTLTYLLVGGSWGLAVVSSNGLETTLACWLMTLLVASLFTGEASRRPVFIGVCAAGLVATRPEGIAVTFFLALVSLAVESREIPPWRRCVWFAGAAASQALIEIYRLVYYHQLLPNTFFAKRADLGKAAHAGLLYLNDLVLPGIPTLIRVEILLVILVGVYVVVRSPNRRLLYIVTAVAIQVLFIVETGGDWMLGGRFLAPVLPLVAVLMMLGTVRVIEFSRNRLSSGLRWLQWTVCAILVLVVLSTAVLPTMKERDPIWNSHWHFDDASLVRAGGYGLLSLEYWPLGLAMLRCVPSGSLVAYTEVGYAGFERLDVRFLDMRGLTDTSIAHTAPANVKDDGGVTQYTWTSPSSVVGQTILADRPVAVLTFDWQTFPPRYVLGGAYINRETAIYPLWTFFKPLVLYQRTTPPSPKSDVFCDRSATQ